MDVGYLIGLLGGIVLSISFFPQIKRMWDERKGDFEQISFLWIMISLLGCVLYFSYGIIIMQPGIIILNIVAAICYLLMFWIWLKAKLRTDFAERLRKQEETGAVY